MCNPRGSAAPCRFALVVGSMSAEIIPIGDARRARRSADIEHLRAMAERARRQRLDQLLGPEPGDDGPRAA